MKHTSGYEDEPRRTAFEAGYRGYQRGKHVNPHPPVTRLYHAWHNGWMYAARLAKERGHEAE
jgi:hypothetical protein